jgi:hypothetical protein
MNLDELIKTIPSDLKFAVMAGNEDPDLASGSPALRAALRASRDRRKVSSSQVAEWSEEIQSWIQVQQFLQGLAEQVEQQLMEYYPFDLGEDVLPAWMFEWWAPLLQNPWSDRLDEVVVAAQQWLDGQ